MRVIGCCVNNTKRHNSNVSFQVLQYVGDHNTVGFWYNWIKYSERLENDLRSRQMVFCGDSFPIFWTEKSVLGKEASIEVLENCKIYISSIL